MLSDKVIAIAPMMACTDRHCRYLLRLLSQQVHLYTEMITTGALLYGDERRLLAFHPDEHPIVLQLGGSCPEQLGKCAQLGQSWGYDAINLNVGCPSNNVQDGGFGVRLMLERDKVARCVAAMKSKVNKAVTVKTRIGVDNYDNYPFLRQFVQAVVDAGCDGIVVHARKAWLKGLSPKQNRQVPPLNYDVVYQLKQDFPKLPVIINGGIATVAAIREHLQHTDGVMIGRKAYYDPFWLHAIDNIIMPHSTMAHTRGQILQQYCAYIAQQYNEGVRLYAMTRHLLGFFKGLPGAKSWRIYVSNNKTTDNIDDWLQQGLLAVSN